MAHSSAAVALDKSGRVDAGVFSGGPVGTQARSPDDSSMLIQRQHYSLYSHERGGTTKTTTGQ